MSNEKQLRARFQQKCDIEYNWLRATGFVPLKGEFVIYEAEKDTTPLPMGRVEPITTIRIKVGNGVDNINKLPFISFGQGGDGQGGIGISNALINDFGELVFIYIDGTSSNLGKVVGEDGVDGKDGADGKDGVDGKDGADGKDGVDGKDGADGKDGVDGVGISSVIIDNQDNLIITLTNNTSLNLGSVRGQPGEPGRDAPQESVLYIEQVLEEPQQEQARKNICAAASEELNELKEEFDIYIKNSQIPIIQIIRLEADD